MRDKIQDCILIANELIDSNIKDKSPTLLVKMDFYKAFDCVAWEYIDYVLNICGFGLRWKAWIQAYISTTHASVIFNGTIKWQIQSSRGILQGDPLSLFLFVITAEGLTRMRLKA